MQVPKNYRKGCFKSDCMDEEGGVVILIDCPGDENCVVCGYELKIRSRTYDTCNSCYFDKLEGESTLSKKKM